jgi:hypothetical protein
MAIHIKLLGDRVTDRETYLMAEKEGLLRKLRETRDERDRGTDQRGEWGGKRRGH